MRSVVVFPGQGAQYVGMAAALMADEPIVAETLAQADAALGLPLSRLITTGPAEELASTAVTQPAVLTVSVAMWRLLRQRHPELVPLAAAGHSLGEYSALVAADALDFEDAVRLVHLRGRLMQSAVPAGRGSMAAILGLDGSVVEALCAECEDSGVVRAACFNGPGQVVVAGEVGALEALFARAKQADCRGVVPLAVSAPFHTPLLEPAGRGLAEALASVRIRPPSFPVLQNVDASGSGLPTVIADKLVRQVTEPVRWEACARGLLALEPDRAIEVGPGTTLAGLFRRISRRFPVIALDRQGAWEAL
jgi:[acyl-carrier-protein] S-malonyltransferase